MKIRVKTATLFLILFLCGVSACAVETVLDIPKNEAYTRLLNGDAAFILDAEPARAAEISKIDAALPFYAALLIAGTDDERTRILLNEALKSPVVRDAAMKKLAAPPESEAAARFEGGLSENIAAGRAAIAKRDYNEALRKFRAALGEEDAEVFIADQEVLGDLGKAFQFASGGAVTGAELFMTWEKGLRDGSLLWSMPGVDRDARRYLLLFYAGRMRRQRGEHDEAKALFTSALYIAPDETQSDACIWYILDMAKNDERAAATLVKQYAPLWHDPSYFSDFFEKFTHRLCLNQRWDEIAELFPYIRRYGGPELSAKYAFILGNAVELNFLTREKAAAALEPLFPAPSGVKTAFKPPHPEDFYKIAYESDIMTGGDTSSFYYIDAAAKKLGRKPRLNIQDDSRGESAAKTGGDPLVKEFLTGFFTYGAARFAYPYIMENADALSIPEFRALAECLAEAGRWGEAIRAARTYMQRPDYKPALADVKICYPFAYKDLVTEFSRKTGVDENLLQGLIRTESLFIPDVVSRAGATGLTQLMPETAGEMARQLARSGGPDYIKDGGLDLNNPELNIHLGALYFQQLKTRTNSTLLALLSYNGGITRVGRWRRSRPALNDALFLESVEYAETRDYGRQVLTAAAIYRCLRSMP
jgi:soluble lytic murein transglycosylase